MRGGYTIPGYFEVCNVVDNKVKTKGFSGRVLYVFKNGTLKEPGLLGKTVLIFKNGGIFKPGLFGSKLFSVTKIGEVKEIGLFGKSVGAIPAHWVYPDKEIQENHDFHEDSKKRNEQPRNIVKTVTQEDDSTTYKASGGDTTITFTVSESKPKTEEELFLSDYNEVVAYTLFLNKFSVIKTYTMMEENDYPHWMFMSAGVKEVLKLHKELETKGFYEQAGVLESLSTYKVSEIHEIATKIGVELKGNKANKTKQLSEFLTIERLQEIMGDKFLKLSRKAFEYLENHKLEYEYYTSNDNPNITFEQYSKVRKTKSIEDIELEKANKIIKEDKRDWGWHGFYSRYKLHLNREEYVKATHDLLTVLLLDISGSSMYYYIQNDPDNLKYRTGESSKIAFPPARLQEIRKLEKFITGEMINNVYKIKLPINACSKEMFEQIIKDILSGSIDTKKYVEILGNNYEKITSLL